MGVGISGVSRRHDAGRRKVQENGSLRAATEQLETDYDLITNGKEQA